MIEESKYYADDSSENDEYSLPSKSILLVDTTLNDNLDNLLIPDIPTKGQILLHNNKDVSYEDSSNFFFDNVRKLKDSPQPITITLQFRLGLHDDGSSLNDLLANFLQKLGCFKFKFYIFKIYFKALDIIGFRFDTDLIPKILDLSEEDQEANYLKNVNFHIVLDISWLKADIEEIHLGQKIRLDGYEYYKLVFPKLTNLGFECYDLVTSHNWAVFLYLNNKQRKSLILRDFQSGRIFVNVKLRVDKLYLIGSELPIMMFEIIKYLWEAKEIHLYGTALCYEDLECNINQLPVVTETIYYSPNPNSPSQDADVYNKGIKKFCSDNEISLIEVPFLPEYQTAVKSTMLRGKHSCMLCAADFRDN
ncbi:hypothetical protein DFJ63DRAFT_337634 [Scheffersomyces coipomensis]|uniref:uncharacterized protein n=1 Tax=Scheffersomyces coipomensis TaxID=1788519 RepID=UPI00315D085F